MNQSVSYKFLDIDHFREQLRGRDTAAVQIERGQIIIQFRSINLGRLIFCDNRTNRKSIDHSRIENGWAYFIINLSPAIFCGANLGGGHMSVLSPGREYRSILSGDWHAIGILIELSLLAEEGISLPPHLLLDPENASIPLPVELVGIFRRLAETAFDGKDGGPIDGAWLQGALLRALDKALRVGARDRDTVHSRRAIEGYELTQRMIRYVESRFGQRITVNDIAGELNVTPRALHYATRSTLGVSPLDLILAFRLNHVRNELWERRLSEAGITHAALMQDFAHLGRFSRQYQTLFGEMPSQTLRRIRSIAE